jgi:bifunctional DNA-binding transcriptional regulator/antitoxin component of YhaV-PrlF toxin-antitoxin module
MSQRASHAIALGDEGCFVIPSEIRARHRWTAGTPLLAIDTGAALLVMSSDEALRLLRSRMDGRDLVAELLIERQREVQEINGSNSR